MIDLKEVLIGMIYRKKAVLNSMIISILFILIFVIIGYCETGVFSERNALILVKDIVSYILSGSAFGAGIAFMLESYRQNCDRRVIYTLQIQEVCRIVFLGDIERFDTKCSKLVQKLDRCNLQQDDFINHVQEKLEMMAQKNDKRIMFVSTIECESKDITNLISRLKKNGYKIDLITNAVYNLAFLEKLNEYTQVVLLEKRNKSYFRQINILTQILKRKGKNLIGYILF